MTKMITIHPGSWNKVRKYGYESTQLARQDVADYLGWNYIYLLTYPQLRADWKKDYEKIGFRRSDLINVANYQSDIGEDELSVRPEDIKDKYPNAEIEVINGYVAAVKTDEETLYFTSALFLKEDKDGVLEWYNKDGSLVMKAREFNPDKEPTPLDINVIDYLYYKDGEWLSNEDLTIKVLIDIANENDLIIRDQHQYIRPKLWRYMENTNKNYYEIIHHNLVIDPLKNLRRKTHYLVASEPLTKIVVSWGFKAQFMPPMILPKRTDVVTKRKNLHSFCFVGNMSDVKRPEIAVEAFRKLYEQGIDVDLTLYGGDVEAIIEKVGEVTPNIHLAGYVPSVPYIVHDAYISASISELFANACVEAMSYGLLPILSNVDIAHRYYAVNNPDIKLFDDVDELVAIIEKLATSDEVVDTSATVEFVKRYSIENVAERFRALIK